MSFMRVVLTGSVDRTTPAPIRWWMSLDTQVKVMTSPSTLKCHSQSSLVWLGGASSES